LQYIPVTWRERERGGEGGRERGRERERVCVHEGGKRQQKRKKERTINICREPKNKVTKHIF